MVSTKTIVLTTSISFLGTQIHAWNISKMQHATSLAAGAALLSTGWAIKEWCQRTSQKKELEGQLCQQKVQANTQIKKLTDEMKALQEDEYFLVEKTECVEKVQNLCAPVEDILSKETLVNEDIQLLIEFFENSAKRTASSFDHFEEMLQKELSVVEKHHKELSEKINEWRVKQSLYLHIKGQELIVHFETLSNFLRQLIHISKQQKGFFALKALVTSEYSARYTFEYKALGDESVLGLLSDRIAALYETEKFPYVAYETELEREGARLEKVLSSIDEMQSSSFQQRLIEYAHSLYTAFKVVRSHVRATPFFKEQEFLSEWTHMRSQIDQIEKQVTSNEVTFQKELSKLQSQYQTLNTKLERSTRVQDDIQSLCSQLGDKVHSLRRDINSLQAQHYISYTRK